MEAARAVKMRRQNMREQNKFDDRVFATVETTVKELERSHLFDRKDHQHVLVDRPAEAYQPTDVREYFSA